MPVRLGEQNKAPRSSRRVLLALCLLGVGSPWLAACTFEAPRYAVPATDDARTDAGFFSPDSALEPDAGARSVVADADRRPGRTGDEARGPAGAARRGTSETQCRDL